MHLSPSSGDRLTEERKEAALLLLNFGGLRTLAAQQRTSVGRVEYQLLQELTAPSGSPPTAALNLSLQPPQSPAGAGAGAQLGAAPARPQGGGREVEQQQEQPEPRQLGIGPHEFDEIL